jgi:hypothetical protein
VLACLRVRAQKLHLTTQELRRDHAPAEPAKVVGRIDEHLGRRNYAPAEPGIGISTFLGAALAWATRMARSPAAYRAKFRDDGFLLTERAFVTAPRLGKTYQVVRSPLRLSGARTREPFFFSFSAALTDRRSIVHV